MLYLPEELPLAYCLLDRIRVTGIQHALHDSPAIEQSIPGDVDPTESAVRRRPGDLVLIGHHIAALQRGPEVIGLAAERAEPVVIRERHRFGAGVVGRDAAAFRAIGSLVRRNLPGGDEVLDVLWWQRRQRDVAGTERRPATGRRRAAGLDTARR